MSCTCSGLVATVSSARQLSYGSQATREAKQQQQPACPPPAPLLRWAGRGLVLRHAVQQLKLNLRTGAVRQDGSR